MRLTNVAQMDLVSGRLFSYAVQASPENGRPLPISFDQGRHVGEGQRPGSWLALAFRLAEPATPDELATSWDAVVARHGTLRTAFSQTEDGELHLHQVEVSPGTWREHEVVPGRPTREVLREVLDAGCAPFERPSHRLCLIDPDSAAGISGSELVIGADHAHLDMWSLVILARDLVTCLDDLRAGRELGAALPEAPPFAEHTAELTAMPPAPDEVQQRWAEILGTGDGNMPVFQLYLGQLTPLPAEVVEVRDVLDAAGTERLTALARECGVRPLSLAISVLTDVTVRLTERPLRAVFPVHSRHDAGWRDAVGWFITNAVIESSDPDPVACKAAITEATGLGSWPLASITVPSGGMQPVPGMFAISWLDTRRLPLLTESATDLRYVSAAIRTDGVMIWFMVNETGLHLRCRYPDTPEARENVGRWLDAVELGLRELAAAELTT